ncbi:MAG: hypothetical protein AB7T49_10715 [Oligoflexales bacterium]
MNPIVRAKSIFLTVLYGLVGMTACVTNSSDNGSFSNPQSYNEPHYPAKNSRTIAAQVPVDDRVGNGGNIVAGEFAKRAYTALSYLSHLPDDQWIADFNRDKLPLLKEAVKLTPVQVVQKDFLDNKGNKVDAKVEPDPKSPNGKKIMLHEESWQKLFNSSLASSHIILHEYLRVIGIDDDQFKISSQINFPNADPRWGNPCDYEKDINFLWPGCSNSARIKPVSQFNSFMSAKHIAAEAFERFDRVAEIEQSLKQKYGFIEVVTLATINLQKECRSQDEKSCKYKFIVARKVRYWEGNQRVSLRIAAVVNIPYEGDVTVKLVNLDRDF